MHSTVRPKNSAILILISSRGILLPHSYMLIALALVPSTLDSSSADRPRSFRSSWIFFPVLLQSTGSYMLSVFSFHIRLLFVFLSVTVTLSHLTHLVNHLLCYSDNFFIRFSMWQKLMHICIVFLAIFHVSCYDFLRKGDIIGP